MRVFALGLLLIGCSGAPGGEQGAAQGSTAGEASSPGAGGEPSGGSGMGGVLSLARAGASAGGGGQGGEPLTAAAGTGGAPSVAGGGGSGSGGAGGSGGAASGGSGGSTDPLAPFPAPGCEDWTAYRIPQGQFLAVTGDFDVNGLKDGQCMALSGALYKQTCDAAANVSQCVCTVSSPPSCGQYCDGEYLVTALKAEPGKTFIAKLMPGDGHCLNGVPVAK